LIQINEHAAAHFHRPTGSRDASYYSLIRRTSEGGFVACIPDLPGITAAGLYEDEVLREVSQGARECLCKIAIKGLLTPKATSPDELPIGDRVGLYRRVLLLLLG
jgi:predicted RNase H-like HicB family nuclease